MSGLILLVEDEQDLAKTLDYNIRRDGFETRCAFTGAEALELANQEPLPSLVLLDLMLPDMSGIEICRQLRMSPNTRAIPIIILTAKGEEIDRVVGFEVGADDYVVKPFSVRELMLRIRAILRRTDTDQVQEETPDLLQFNELTVDLPGHRVTLGDEEIRLTALEFRLLQTFLTRKGRVQTREALLNDVWGIKADVTTRTVDTHVKRLREKLQSAGSYIETLRGVGYRWKEKPEEVEE